MRFALPILMLMPAFLPAQNISASLSGVIEDSAGARVPAVEVTLTSQQGFVRTMKTNAEGYFSFPDLTPGMYALTATVPGFRKHIQPDIELSSSLVRMLPAIRLQVGEIAESVTVTADAAPVQLGSSDRAGTLSSEDLQTIALRGRDFMDVVGLLPGVVDTADSREAPTEASTRGIYILGGRTTAKNITVDGVTNVDTSSNQEMHNAPSMDSISEVKVLMSNYSAEYGRNAGGSVNIITRGGGRQFHGSASWYHRHESYSANEWFNNANRVSRPRYRYNIPGYTVGGPVYIPRVWNTDRTRLFFFFSQEFQRQLQDYGTRKVTVPSALQREGDFSQTFDLNGRLTTVWDPLNNRTAFPGNVIPKSRFDPVGRKVLDLFPLPNFADPNPVSRYQWNFIAAQSGPFPRHSEIVRFDFAPRQNMQMNVRYTNTKSEAHPPWGNWVNGRVNFPLTATVLRRPGRGATVRNTTTLSATVFSEFTFGFSQFENFYGPEFPERVSRQGTGINIPQWNPKLNPQGFLPNMTFTSVPNYANPSMSNPPYYGAEHIYSLVENLSKIAGTHTFKAGVYLEWLRDDVFANSLVRGAISFNRDTNNPLDTNYAYSNALMGIYQSYSEANARPPAQFRYTDVHFYVQDAWRISRRLMIDYGLRISRVAPAYEKSGTSSTFVPDLWDPARAPVLLRPALNERNVKVALDPTSGKTYSQALIGTYAPGVGDPATGMALAGTRGLPKSLYTVAPVSFAPRLGFAFDPFGRGRTALRRVGAGR
ncbi:MAG: carboxypeptidase regulatory-like domain-containing protein, partial [Acidobacteria bacterium]|nr:carboxypeptidase regulatory-like domain-containing protein [Acidobacteriota bacterium]